MSENLYEPLPDVDAYLRRIGVECAREPTPAFLDELIDAHQHAVPFENLDICELGLTPSLGIADLFDKVVTRKRGGYCFELNALFNALLRALGFETRPCMARVLFRPTPYPALSHRANFVTIDGRDYLADVGFGGPMPDFAPLVEDGASRTSRGRTFTMCRRDDFWWDVCYTGSAGREQRVLGACAMPVEEYDFVLLSFFQANNPASVFKLNRMANIKTTNGAFDLRNLTFTEYCGNEKKVVELAEEQLAPTLAEKFGIAL